MGRKETILGLSTSSTLPPEEPKSPIFIEVTSSKIDIVLILLDIALSFRAASTAHPDIGNNLFPGLIVYDGVRI